MSISLLSFLIITFIFPVICAIHLVKEGFDELIYYLFIFGVAGHHRTLLRMLDLGASPDYRDANGLSALYHCCVHGGGPNCIRTAEILLKDACQVGVVDDHLWTELHQAARYGHDTHVEMLLLYGADVNAANDTGMLMYFVCWVGSMVQRRSHSVNCVSEILVTPKLLMPLFIQYFFRYAYTFEILVKGLLCQNFTCLYTRIIARQHCTSRMWHM